MEHHRCPGRTLSRRRFVSTLGATAAGLFLGGPVWARHVPAAATVARGRVGTYEYGRLRGALEAMLGDLGGLGDVVRPGAAVGIKINLTGSSDSAARYRDQTGLHPGETYWTHPEVLRVVGELLRDAGAGTLYVLEAAADAGCVEDFGYRGVIDHLGATFVDLNGPHPYGGFAERPVGGSPFIYERFVQNGILGEIDAFVSLAKSKQHVGAGVTHGMKNLVGTLPMNGDYHTPGSTHRNLLHENDGHDGVRYNNLRRIIMDLNRAAPIDLVVDDAVATVLGGEGPWQPLRTARFDTLVASKDPVAADAVATAAIGLDPTAADGTDAFAGGLNYLRLASELGLGTHDPDAIDVVEATGTTTDDDAAIPSSGVHVGTHPNPFVTSVTLTLTRAESGFTSVELYDIRGRRLRTLARRTLPAGESAFAWDGRDATGVPVPAGAYLALVRTERRTTTHRLVRVR